jgi:hypothetical protein
MLSVKNDPIMLSDFMICVVRLSVVMLYVVAPLTDNFLYLFHTSIDNNFRNKVIQLFFSLSSQESVPQKTLIYYYLKPCLLA